MTKWIDVALEEGVRFFVTSLGNPRWVVERVGAVGGVVYHDVTERKWALKGREAGVHGLICVNSQAGGHAGPGELAARWVAATACSRVDYVVDLHEPPTRQGVGRKIVRV